MDHTVLHPYTVNFPLSVLTCSDGSCCTKTALITTLLWHTVRRRLLYMCAACVRGAERPARPDQGVRWELVHQSAVTEAVEAWRAVKSCSLMMGCSVFEQHKGVWLTCSRPQSGNLSPQEQLKTSHRITPGNRKGRKVRPYKLIKIQTRPRVFSRGKVPACVTDQQQLQDP